MFKYINLYKNSIKNKRVSMIKALKTEKVGPKRGLEA